ncbi:hypothetical protein JW964_05580 [candidate division KSB1 bacterium]|nr:hypothetical protein [candidate division KSB1 bacterium]
MNKSIDKSIPSQKPKLRDPVQAAIRTKHFSTRNEEAYIRWIQGCDMLMRTQLLPIQIRIVTSEFRYPLNNRWKRHQFEFTRKKIL